MAGMAVQSIGGMMSAPPGMVWDANLRGYVPKAQQPGGQNMGQTPKFSADPSGGGAVISSYTPNARGSAQNADATRPQYEVSPTGHAMSYNYQTGTWDDIGMAGSGGYGGSGSGSGSSGSGAGAGRMNFQSLIDQLRSTPSSYEAPQIDVTTSGANGGSPYDLRGEDAAYGAAKNRIGLSTQAAIRGLRNSLANTGKLGTGAEATQVTGLYRGGLGELADTDRQLAEQRATRAFTAGQSDTDRTISQNEYNASAVERARQASIANSFDKLRMIMSAYGQMY